MAIENEQSTFGSPTEEHLKVVLRKFNYECGDHFDYKYMTDHWVYNLANVVNVLAYANERLLDRIAKLEKALNGD